MPVRQRRTCASAAAIATSGDARGIENITFRKWRKDEGGLIDPWLPGQTPCTSRRAMRELLEKPMAVSALVEQ